MGDATFDRFRTTVYSGNIRLAEVIGPLSQALDMTTGQPPGHCLRSAWIAMQVGKAAGLSEAKLMETGLGPAVRFIFQHSNPDGGLADRIRVALRNARRMRFSPGVQGAIRLAWMRCTGA